MPLAAPNVCWLLPGLLWLPVQDCAWREAYKYQVLVAQPRCCHITDHDWAFPLFLSSDR